MLRPVVRVHARPLERIIGSDGNIPIDIFETCSLTALVEKKKEIEVKALLCFWPVKWLGVKQLSTNARDFRC